MSPLFRSYLAVAALVAAVSPLRAQVSVLSSTVEEREVVLGQTYTGRIVIANTSAVAQAVRLYQTDYGFKADGTSTFGDPGTTSRSNAKWITPQTNNITVPPNSEITVPYSIKVPETDSLTGTYWSAIMVEGAEAAPPPLTGGRAGQAQVGIGAVIRYAVQVATHVGKTGMGAIKFENPKAVKMPNGDGALDIDVISTGSRGIRPMMSVELYDAQGVLKGRGKAQRGLLYPGTGTVQHFEFGALPPGTYKAVVFADIGNEKVTAVQTHDHVLIQVGKWASGQVGRWAGLNTVESSARGVSREEFSKAGMASYQKPCRPYELRLPTSPPTHQPTNPPA